MPYQKVTVGGTAIDPPRSAIDFAAGDGCSVAATDSAGSSVVTYTSRGPGVWSLYIPLAQLANAQTYIYTPGVAGRIKSVRATVITAATTAAKAATLTAKVATVACTGGVVALTSANCTPIGVEVAGTAVSAGNTFTAAQAISIDVSSVTTFIEGAIMVNVAFA